MSKQPTIRAEVAGYFRFEATDTVTGKTRVVADWQPNLITNSGLDLLGNDAALVVMAGVRVGSGQNLPNVNDTALQNQVAAIASGYVSAYPQKGTASSSPYHGYIRARWQFGMGVAAGNLSEVGVFSSTGVMFSRALIKDAGGSPITITILATELLDVIYELRVYPNAVDSVTTVTASDATDHEVTVRAARVTDTEYWSIAMHVANVSKTKPASVFAPQSYIANGALGSVTSSPAGTQVNVSMEDQSYVPAAHYRDHRLNLNLTQGNLAGGIAALVYGTSLGYYQIGFNPPIAKDNTRTLRITVRTSWARRP